jgi:hypothetical protein
MCESVSSARAIRSRATAACANRWSVAMKKSLNGEEA